MGFYISSISSIENRNANLTICPFSLFNLDINHFKNVYFKKNNLITKNDDRLLSNSKRNILLYDEISFKDIIHFLRYHHYSSIEIVCFSNNLVLLLQEAASYLLEHELSVGILTFNENDIASNINLIKDNNVRIAIENKDYPPIKTFHVYENRCVNEKVVFSSLPFDKSLRKKHKVKTPPLLSESFLHKLIYYMNRSKKTNVEIYTKGGITRKVFSKIISSKSYHPKKETIICLIIGMELCLDDALDLLMSAGFTLSSSILLDYIVKNFIIERNYDLDQINEELDKYNEPSLGWKPRED